MFWLAMRPEVTPLVCVSAVVRFQVVQSSRPDSQRERSAVVELSSEEESALRELVDARERGERAGSVIDRRIAESLTRKGPDGRLSISCRDVRALYDGLVEKGLVDAYVLPRSAEYTYEDLTSAGRCYFKDKATREAREEELRDEQFHRDMKVATISAVMGGVFGLLTGTFGGALGELIAREAIPAALKLFGL